MDKHWSIFVDLCVSVNFVFVSDTFESIGLPGACMLWLFWCFVWDTSTRLLLLNWSLRLERLNIFKFFHIKIFLKIWQFTITRYLSEFAFLWNQDIAQNLTIYFARIFVIFGAGLSSTLCLNKWTSGFPISGLLNYFHTVLNRPLDVKI